MKKIITKFYIILLLVTISGCETSKSINYDLNVNKGSTDAYRVINISEIIGSIDSSVIY